MQNATTPAMIASKAIGMTTARMIVSLSSKIRQEGNHCYFVKTESPGTSCNIRPILITLQKVLWLLKLTLWLCNAWWEGRQRAMRRYRRHRRSRKRTTSRKRFDLRFLTRQKASCGILLCSTRKLTGLVLLKVVKPSPDLKMMKLLTFVKSFPSQEHLRYNP